MPTNPRTAWSKLNLKKSSVSVLIAGREVETTAVVNNRDTIMAVDQSHQSRRSSRRRISVTCSTRRSVPSVGKLFCNRISLIRKPVWECAPLMELVTPSSLPRSYVLKHSTVNSYLPWLSQSGNRLAARTEPGRVSARLSGPSTWRSPRVAPRLCLYDSLPK
jgi:hypothetical protein